MHRRIRYLGTFLPHQLSPEVKELYTSSIMMNFGLAMVQMFEPIYLYSIGYSLPMIMWFFLVVYGLYFIWIPLGAKFAGRFGTERSIELSTIFISLLYICLFAVQYDHHLFYVAAVLYALQKMFYWPAFHADFAQNAASSERAREVSSLTVATSLVFVAGPILAGYLITIGGFGWLFILASLIFLLSNLPLMTTEEKFVPFSFPYWRTYRSLFSATFWRLKLSYLGYAEEFVVMVVWPVFIALIVKDDFRIGLVISLMVLVSTVVTLVAGKFADHHR
ncbi:MAG: MFS transporter, partial [Candidatus Komeilibacteria bacterium]